MSENTAAEIACDNTCRLFAAGSLGAYFGKIKVSRCRIWQYGMTLTRDFIPVLDKSGIPCMYDKCTKTFFYNAGSGNFNYA